MNRSSFAKGSIMIKALSAAVCGALLAVAFTVSGQTLKPGIVTVVRIQGMARYSLDNVNWHPLVVGKALGAGAIIQTAHDSFVDFVLGKNIDVPQAAQWPDRIGPAPDYPVRGLVDYQPSAEQNMVRMMSDAVLAIDKLTISDTGVDAVSDTELDLKQGRIFCSVRKLSAASQYLVKIPNGIAGVRGTIFGIDASGWCAVYKGSVVLSLIGPSGTPVSVVISEGNYLGAPGSSGGGVVTPMTSDMIHFLGEISTALDTLYFEVVSFTHDHTIVYVSPTSGHR